MTTPPTIIIDNITRVMTADTLVRELMTTHQVDEEDIMPNWIYKDEVGMKKLVSFCVCILSLQRNRIISSIEKKDTALLAKALAEATDALFGLTDKEPTDKARKLKEALTSAQTGRVLDDNSWFALREIVNSVLCIVNRFYYLVGGADFCTQRYVGPFVDDTDY